MDNRVAGRKISALRQARGLTQQQLAAMMSVSHQAVSKWESGLALPDISTMLELTRFFGITVEQLFEEENPLEETTAREASSEENNAAFEPDPAKEVKNMNIQQLLQMAPFMSKAAVEEIALGIEEPISAQQFAKLAPFISAEALTRLVNKHRPRLSWETLRKIAPFMERDAVDALARAVASGEEYIEAEGGSRTLNDIGKAFDSFGKDFSQAFDDFGRKAKKGVKKTIRFGKKVIDEVSSAINDLADDAQTEITAPVRSEKALALRRKVFERALKDGRWDWLEQHLSEIENDVELKTQIAAGAKEAGMHDWICKNLGGYADEVTIKAAIAAENWDWLGENAWLFDPEMQKRVALAAMRAENWKWLVDYATQLQLKECAFEIAQAALRAGEKLLAADIANAHLTQQEAAALAREARASGDYGALELLFESAGREFFSCTLAEFAENGQWDLVLRYISAADAGMIEKHLEIAIEQGNFDMIDCLDQYL